jgi:ParB family transcriptional regulator, chromosome partitioning protein
MQSKRGLGRGIESLIPPPIASEVDSMDAYFRIVSIDTILPNRMQPRTVFDEEKLRELADSIREQGVLQPLSVMEMTDGRYELIAGERRLRASKIAGLEEVPVVLRKVDDETLLALSIIENIQREDLNAIEEARAFQELIDQFDYSQEDVAKKLGRSRTAVTNSLRLLRLPRVVQEDVASGRYSAGHARAILSVEGLHEQLKLRERIIREMPTVRDVEKMVQTARAGGKSRAKRKPQPDPQMRELADSMKQALGTKVTIEPTGSGGRLVVEYYSTDDLDRIYQCIVK